MSLTNKDKRYQFPTYPRNYLFEMRTKLNISSEEMSRRLDVSKSYYYSIETGGRGHKMNVVLLSKIILVLGVDANEIIEAEVQYQNERKVYLEENKKRLARSTKRN